LQFAFVTLGTLGLSGLWHGAAWNFIFWGLYHGVLVFVYHQLSMGGHWKPKGIVNTFLAWLAMSCFTLGGWFLFRAPNISWIKQTLSNLRFVTTPDISATAFEILFFIALYSIPLLVITFMNKLIPNIKHIHFIVYGAMLASIFIFFSEQGQDFIYFQF
jgi:alginate O-acetyltransferase complex protein AlgI